MTSHFLGKRIRDESRWLHESRNQALARGRGWRKVLRALRVLGSLVMAASCSRGAPEEISQAPFALSPSLPAVSTFALLATRTIALGDRTSLTGGDIGVAAGAGGPSNSLTVGFDSRVAVGNMSSAPVIRLRDRAVLGEIAATVIDVPRTASTGPQSPFIAPPAAPLPGVFASGTLAIAVAGGQTRTLPAGRYGAVVVRGVLQLSGGLYEVRSLRVEVGASVVATAASTVRISTGLVAADRARVGAAPPLRAGALRLVAAGTTDDVDSSVILGTDNRLTALIVARNGFRAGDRLVAAGAISARDIRFGNDSRMTFDGGFDCGAADGCRDSNACTIEACVDARCVSTEAARGTVCDDDDLCTQSGRLCRWAVHRHQPDRVRPC